MTHKCEERFLGLSNWQAEWGQSDWRGFIVLRSGMLESEKAMNPWGPVQSLRTGEGVVGIRSADVWGSPGGVQTKG